MTALVPVLRPPPTKPHTSVARVTDDWYVVCRASRLRKKPRAVTLLGMPLVLFRGRGGEPAALLDRCPHRNVPLSGGEVRDGLVACPYHGWRFDGSGCCREVPGLAGSADSRARRAPCFAAREQDGFIWVYATPDVEPAREPFRFPLLGEPGYSSTRLVRDFPGTLHATAENALDVPHTAFVHGGLFRTPARRVEIDVVVHRYADRAEAEYIGEPRPTGIVGRVLAPGGGTVVHFDRFILPGIAQVEYRLGDRSHLVLTTALTPVEDFVTRMFAVATFRLPLPGWLVVPFLKPAARFILRQDARMLAKQTAAVRRFGGERYVFTEIDSLGPHILRLLKQAERGTRGDPDAPPAEKRFRMIV